MIDEERIAVAVESLKVMLHVDHLDGSTFLDVGCGSGLFSLAAVRLGAMVRSFDFDPQSVACTEEMKRRFAPDAEWIISSGSILDDAFVATLPESDIVYSWGVLHHTGKMWEAIESVLPLVAPSGQLAISIYNDQGGASRRWRVIKKVYNQSPSPLKSLIALGFGLSHELRQALIRVVRLQNPLPFADWRQKKQDRGMSPWHDIVDWIGGYPFEVAKPEEVFLYCRRQGFELTHLTTQAGGYGCNEFVFRRRTFNSD
ncbi:class I SAM-dependent methyltransferase [Planctomicrobium sp. SH527]|uniref:class I SAM-dependent methyltransferase n=1 Tax=Planctomicrobium sp. SH527 TaxID=3448123 RepID=UPI003F5C3CCF